MPYVPEPVHANCTNCRATLEKVSPMKEIGRDVGEDGLGGQWVHIHFECAACGSRVEFVRKQPGRPSKG